MHWDLSFDFEHTDIIRTFCLDHRSEYAHKCKNEGRWARERREKEDEGKRKKTILPPKPSLYNHDQQCYEKSCKTLVDTHRMPANPCSSCNKTYCLKHRMPEDHDCKNVPRQGAIPTSVRNQTLSALQKIKLWADNKRKEDEKRRAPKKSGFLGLGKSSSAASTAQAELNTLKRTAKGDNSVPHEKRIYLHVEASADTTKAKFPTGKFYYNKEWTVGRVLDMAAKALQVQNVNNRGGGEEEKLRVFHVEGGRLLKFNEKIGEPCTTGNMIVLLRGVGSGEAPDLIDL